MRVRFAAQKKRLRLRAISQSRNRYPKGGRTNLTGVSENADFEKKPAEKAARWMQRRLLPTPIWT